MDMTPASGLKFSKPEPRKRSKGREDRRETRIKEAVRKTCVWRDGYCRITADKMAKAIEAFAVNPGFISLSFPALRDCDGPSEWAHLETNRRFKTRGRSPELRHTTAGTCMLCHRHHELYDARKLRLRFRTNRGADGAIEWRLAK